MAEEGVGWDGCRRRRLRAVLLLCPAEVLLWQLLVARPASRVGVVCGPGCTCKLAHLSPGHLGDWRLFALLTVEGEPGASLCMGEGGGGGTASGVTSAHR